MVTSLRSIFASVLLAVLILGMSKNSYGQDIKKHKVAIFAPLYLDSAFDQTYAYRYGKNFPKFINPGLEFYEGAQLALDSLGKEGAQLEVFVFDTRAANTTIKSQLEDPRIQDVELIIAHTTSSELRTFAEVGLAKKIPIVNVNLPNDAGITANPYVVLMNPTLRTHIEGIYRYMQKFHALDPIIMFRKKGVQEDQLKASFEDFGKSTLSVPLKIKYVDLDLGFTAQDIVKHLDSNKHSVLVAGSLDENFARILGLELATIAKSYPMTIIGMPTWDGIRDFEKPEYKGLTVVYSTPFYNPRTDIVSLGLVNYFSTYMYARPSDMVFRGYEATWRFSKLLLQYKSDLSSNISRKQYNVFREFDIQPVFLNKQQPALDYFENKKLFFVKLVDGVVTAVN